MNRSFSCLLDWGTELVNGGARFRLWAPAQNAMSLMPTESGRAIPMTESEDGWFELLTDAVGIGQGYSFVLDDGLHVPDPAARAQMGDVHGPSRLVDPEAYQWRAPGWNGRPWEEAVIYELHVGTFSQSGTFDGVHAGLDRLADLGITAVELMPVAQFPGNRGWGYDGVLLYAPHIAYGGPEGLKRLVDAAHERGLMVLLDVVYNHFGPDGNYLHLYAPDFFTRARSTPWGAAIDYGKRAVRDFFLQNVLYWLEEYRFDGLRFDAIDQIEDQTSEPILEEMGRIVRERISGRHIHLTVEDDNNQTHLLKFDTDGWPRLFTAEWNDDWHHAAHVLLTGEQEGYYQDYAQAPAAGLARALAEGFIYQGEPSPYREGRRRGEPSAHLPPTAFIAFLQNHDQIGNRAFGDRITTLAPKQAVEAALALLLLAPQTPLLYMGEEYGEARPFQFFTDFAGDLAKAVYKGRSEEFRRVKSFTDAFAKQVIPDPNDPETFAASRLDPEHADSERLAFVTQLLVLRRARIVPLLPKIGGEAGRVEAQNRTAFCVRWQAKNGEVLSLTANMGAGTAALRADTGDAFVFEYPHGAAAELERGSLPPWSVVCAVSAAERTQ